MGPTRRTELRRLPPSVLYTLSNMLNTSDFWKKVMFVVPKMDNPQELLFTGHHVEMIDNAARQHRRNAAELFLAEWGTMGMKRPDCSLLLNLLIKVELFRVADYFAVEVLQEKPPQRPENGPAADVNVLKILNECTEKMETRPVSFNLVINHKGSSNNNCVNENSENHDSQYDFNEQSDLMKFSHHSNGESQRDLIKFSSRETVSNMMMGNSTLHEVQSENLPVCILQNNSEILSQSIHVSNSAISVDSCISSSESSLIPELDTN